jgi:hypothetical protein
MLIRIVIYWKNFTIFKVNLYVWHNHDITPISQKRDGFITHPTLNHQWNLTLKLLILEYNIKGTVTISFI